MPIDYSKWDNLEVSSSEEEEDDDNPESLTPRVTRLDAPSKITFGGGSATASVSASPQSHTEAPSQPEELRASTTSITTTPSPKSTPQQGNKGTRSSWTDHGGLLETETKGDEGDPIRSLYWAQDRYSVTLRLELRGGEKIRSVVVDGILPYSDRCSAVGSTKPRLVCVSGTSTILLEGELPHPVHLAEEDSDDGLVDWCVVENEHRFLTITLHKAVPMQGLTLWWRRPLTVFPEADLGVLRDGGSSSGDPGSGTKGAASKEFLEAWEEAHKIFRESKQKKGEQKSVI